MVERQDLSAQLSKKNQITEAEKKAIAKATVARKQGFIDNGVAAADAFANVNRAITLLDEVSTGGFDNFALKAKRFFGVESANEGELSNLMGKAVLAQLKPLFGAAFTKSEGDKLDRLEASFGKSVAANKKILDNATKIANRAARRGLAAAEDSGDDFTANEIREALSFRLADKSSATGDSPTTEVDDKPQQDLTKMSLDELKELRARGGN